MVQTQKIYKLKSTPANSLLFAGSAPVNTVLVADGAPAKLHPKNKEKITQNYSTKEQEVQGAGLVTALYSCHIKPRLNISRFIADI